VSDDHKYAHTNTTRGLNWLALTQEEKEISCDFLDKWISILSLPSDPGFVIRTNHSEENLACQRFFNRDESGKKCDTCFIRMCEGCFDQTEVRRKGLLLD